MFSRVEVAEGKFAWGELAAQGVRGEEFAEEVFEALKLAAVKFSVANLAN